MENPYDINKNNGNIPIESNANVKAPSYLTVLYTDFKLPSRDNAIVFRYIEGTSKNEYIVAVGKIIQAKNGLFAFRISNLCVEHFMQKHKGIYLNNDFIIARRLIAPAKRIILSNISPHIPNDVVLREAEKFNLKMVSRI